MKSNTSVALMVSSALMLLATSAASASETGHFSPGLPNIRDFSIPPPGVYGIMYNYFYVSDRINDSDGDEIGQITIGSPPMTATLNGVA